MEMILGKGVSEQTIVCVIRQTNEVNYALKVLQKKPKCQA
jgi:hypothetical protein